MSEQATRRPEDALVLSIDDALRSTSLGVWRFLELEAERKGWVCSAKQRQQIYLHWTDLDNLSRELPAASMANVVRIVGHAEWLAPILALEARVLRDRRSGSSSHDPADYIRAADRVPDGDGCSRRAGRR